MNGRIAKLIEGRDFGFIHAEDGKDYFFHRSGFNGFFDDLVTDVAGGKQIRVTFEVVPSNKGPRAEDVTRTDGGV